MRLRKLLKQSYSALIINWEIIQANFSSYPANPKDSRVLVQMLILFSVGHGAVFGTGEQHTSDWSTSYVRYGG